MNKDNFYRAQELQSQIYKADEILNASKSLTEQSTTNYSEVQVSFNIIGSSSKATFFLPSILFASFLKKYASGQLKSLNAEFDKL